jgi:hypothetical protein
MKDANELRPMITSAEAIMRGLPIDFRIARSLLLRGVSTHCES